MMFLSLEYFKYFNDFWLFGKLTEACVFPFGGREILKRKGDCAVSGHSHQFEIRWIWFLVIYVVQGIAHWGRYYPCLWEPQGLTKNNKWLLQVLKQRLIQGALWDEVGKKAVVKMVRFAWGNTPLQYSCWKSPWMEGLVGLQSMGS